MLFFYTDASALVKRYAPEPGSFLLDHLFANVPPHRLYVLNIGMAEVLSILVRKRNARGLSQLQFTQAAFHLGREIVHAAAVQKVEAINALVLQAMPLVEPHSLNSTDAVLLCSAVEVAPILRAQGNDLVIVASDQRLLRAAQAEKLTTFNPEKQSQTELDALLTVP